MLSKSGVQVISGHNRAEVPTTGAQAHHDDGAHERCTLQARHDDVANEWRTDHAPSVIRSLSDTSIVTRIGDT